MLKDRCLALALVALMAGSSLLPPAHVHESWNPHGGHTAIEHRHFHGEFAGVQGLNTQAPSVDHSGGVTITLESSYTPPSRILLQPVLVTAGAPVIPKSGGDAGIRRRFASRPIHGPPRSPAALRAPPALLTA